MRKCSRVLTPKMRLRNSLCDARLTEFYGMLMCILNKIPFKVKEVLNSPENAGTQSVVLACEVLKVETPKQNVNIYEVMI